MKITKPELEKLIKEELESLMGEIQLDEDYPGATGVDTAMLYDLYKTLSVLDAASIAALVSSGVLATGAVAAITKLFGRPAGRKSEEVP